MSFFRLIKPSWGKEKVSDQPNPDFKETIKGADIFEGSFDKTFLKKKNEEGYSIYFFPNHPSTNVYDNGVKFLKGRDIDVFNFCFVDMDLKDGVYESKEAFLEELKTFELKPTLVVDSGNGIHAYWRFSDLSRTAYILFQLALIKRFKTDSSVWTVLQLMRLPNYMNTKKYDNKILCQALLSEGETKAVYRMSEFPKSALSLLDEKDKQKANNHIARLEGRMEQDFGDDASNSGELPPKFLALMKERKDISDLFERPKETEGDRSAADMKLANRLFTVGFDKKEAYSVLLNTKKAISKGPHRKEYASLTISKVWSSRKEDKKVEERVEAPKNNFMPISEYLKQDHGPTTDPINGPSYLDTKVLKNVWRKKEILGLIGGSGVGKTAVAMNIIKETIDNNPHNDDVYIFFSLEMTKSQIIRRWVSLVGEDSSATDRLYVIDSEVQEGTITQIGLQEMDEYVREVKEVTGKEVGCIVIDHFHIISAHIDLNKENTFGIEGEQGTGYGDHQKLSTNAMATQIKNLAKTLNTFIIVLSQTTKEKGVGDTPIGKDGAYGISQFEWIMDRIITIWQPLMRIQHICNTNFLSFQYVKIREKSEEDRIKEYDPKLLTYDMKSGILKTTTPSEYEYFQTKYPEAISAREESVKNKTPSYSIQLDLEILEELENYQ